MKLFDPSKVEGKLLILGDSITDDGRYVSFLNTYLQLYMPAKQVEIFNLGLSSENLSGLTESTHPFHPRPCLFTRLDKALETVKPDWVLSFYGINDAVYRPYREAHFQKFKDGYLALANRVKESGAKLIALTPIPFDTLSYPGGLPQADDNVYVYKPEDIYAGYNEIMRRYAAWMMEELPPHCELVVDLFAQMEADRKLLRSKNKKCKVGDGIHPDLHGHMKMAQIVLNGAFGICPEAFEAEMKRDRYRLFKLFYRRDVAVHSYYKETVGHGSPYKNKFLPRPQLDCFTEKLDKKIEHYIEKHPSLLSKKDRWHGFRRVNFYFEGSAAIAVLPKKGAATGEWVWRTEFFGAFPDADLQMLKAGCHLVYLAMHDQFGSERSIAQMRRFYDFVRREYGLAQKTALFGFSRGGLYALHFAAKYPELTACMYLDAPVIDIRSWPMGLGAGCGSAEDQPLCLIALGLEKEQMAGYQKVMDSYMHCAAAAGIPLALCAGTKDDIVPYSENGQLLEALWKEKKLPLLVILKPGCAHHPHSIKRPDKITRFLLDYMG